MRGIFVLLTNSKLVPVFKNLCFVIVQVLVQGDILINTSLTEAFCIAIVEAACCGSVCQNPNTAIIDDQSQIIKVGSVNAEQCIFDIYNVSEYDSL